MRIRVVAFAAFAGVVGCEGEPQQENAKSSPFPLEPHEVVLGVAIGPVELAAEDSCRQAEARVPRESEANEICKGGGLLGEWTVGEVRTVPFAQLPEPGDLEQGTAGVSSRMLVRDAVADEGFPRARELAGTNCLCASKRVEGSDDSESLCGVLWRCRREPAGE